MREYIAQENAKFEIKQVGKPQYNVTIRRYKQRYVKKLNLIIQENEWELRFLNRYVEFLWL